MCRDFFHRFALFCASIACIVTGISTLLSDVGPQDTYRCISSKEVCIPCHEVNMSIPVNFTSSCNINLTAVNISNSEVSSNTSDTTSNITGINAKNVTADDFVCCCGPTKNDLSKFACPALSVQLRGTDFIAFYFTFIGFSVLFITLCFSCCFYFGCLDSSTSGQDRLKAQLAKLRSKED